MEIRAGKLMQAAIDCYMAHGTSTPHVVGNTHYSPWFSPGTRVTGSVRVSRPGEDGEGGGVASFQGYSQNPPTQKDLDEMSASWDTCFSRIRATIEDLLRPFDYVPDPARFHDLAESAAQATRLLSTTKVEHGGIKPVAQDIAYIEDTCLGIDGATIYNFKTRFLRRLDDYVTEYYNLSLLLGSGLSGEAKMWANTEKALGAFQSDLDGVINSIRQEEQLLSDSLATSNQIDLTSLNLDNQLHGEDEDGNTLNFGTAAAFAGIDWNSTVLNDIMTHALPNIENYLTQASQSLKQSNSQSVWLRDYRLGIDASGCWSQWNIINSKLGELVRDLAWECETAVELLRRASAAITDETIASAQALADFADQISGGYVEPRPRTGWGNFRVDSQGY